MRLINDVRFWIGIAFLALIILLRYSGLGSYVSIAQVQEQREMIIEYVHDYYWQAVLLYLAIYVVAVLSALPIVALSTVVGGFLFGVVPGTLLANIGATTGAVLFFLIIRHSLGRSIQRKYETQLENFNRKVKKYGVSYLIAIRFIAFIPFFIQNTIIGLTRVSLVDFVWTTSLGVLPGSFVFAYAGQQFAQLTSIRDVFSVPVLIAFVLLMIIGFMPIMLQKYMNGDQA